MDRRAHWQSVYENKGEAEVSWFQDRPSVSLRLIEACGLGMDEPIIDIGGGASRLIDHLLDLGHRNVTVLDIADAALAKARRRLGARAAAVQWIAADITGWTPRQTYGLWHDRAVFHFLTEAADRRAYAAAMSTGLRPGGHAIIGTFAIDGPERCSGLPVCRYDEATIARELASGFRLIDSLADEHMTPAGKAQKFRFFRFARLEEN